MEKKHANPPGNFCSMLPIMHGIDSFSARSEYHLAIKILLCRHFDRRFNFWRHGCGGGRGHFHIRLVWDMPTFRVSIFRKVPEDGLQFR